MRTDLPQASHRPASPAPVGARSLPEMTLSQPSGVSPLRRERIRFPSGAFRRILDPMQTRADGEDFAARVSSSRCVQAIACLEWPEEHVEALVGLPLGESRARPIPSRTQLRRRPREIRLASLPAASRRRRPAEAVAYRAPRTNAAARAAGSVILVIGAPP
jgi:hypothetical protein